MSGRLRIKVVGCVALVRSADWLIPWHLCACILGRNPLGKSKHMIRESSIRLVSVLAVMSQPSRASTVLSQLAESQVGSIHIVSGRD